MRGVKPLKETTIKQFEDKFDFHFCPEIRQFLLQNNAGSSNGSIFTTKMMRTFSCLYDFSENATSNSAWEINRRLRNRIGEKRIIIGKDVQKNYICVERNRREQKIVVWSHVSNEFDPCLMPTSEALALL